MFSIHPFFPSNRLLYRLCDIFPRLCSPCFPTRFARERGRPRARTTRRPAARSSQPRPPLSSPHAAHRLQTAVVFAASLPERLPALASVKRRRSPPRCWGERRRRECRRGKRRRVARPSCRGLGADALQRVLREPPAPAPEGRSRLHQFHHQRATSRSPPPSSSPVACALRLQPSCPGALHVPRRSPFPKGRFNHRSCSVRN